MPFVKMTGSGNDFVFFDGRSIDAARVTQPEVISAICHRYNGIGADGLVVLEAADEGGRIRIRYFNRDGTVGEMCGNATLCSTSLAVLLGLAAPDSLSLLTDAGAVSARLVNGLPEIDVAPVNDVRRSMPSLALETGELQVGYALAGVPHLVIMAEDLDGVEVERRGPPLRQHATLQPAGANVNWVSRLPDGRWGYRTYERGVEGETLACGTGAIAAAILLNEWGLAGHVVELVTRSGRSLHVRLDSSALSNTGPGSGNDEPSPSPQATRGWKPSLRGEGRVVFRGVLGS